MADTKVSALAALTAITGDDGLYVVDDMDGTPVSKSATAAVLRDFTNMVHSSVTGTSGAISAAVNTLYVADMSGWTADRTLTLPTTAAVGDRIGLMVTVGDADYEWLITAATSDTLNGVAGGTEWSRLFITGEVVILRCVTANSAWVVEYDGRIGPLAYASSDASTTQTLTRNVATKITTALATEIADPASEWDATNKKFVARRAGVYAFSVFCQMSGIGADQAVLIIIYKGGAGILYGTVTYSAVAGGAPAVVAAGRIPLAVGDEVEMYVYHEDASTNQATFGGVGRVYFQGQFIGSA